MANLIPRHQISQNSGKWAAWESKRPSFSFWGPETCLHSFWAPFRPAFTFEKEYDNVLCLLCNSPIVSMLPCSTLYASIYSAKRQVMRDCVHPIPCVQHGLKKRSTIDNKKLWFLWLFTTSGFPNALFCPKTDQTCKGSSCGWGNVYVFSAN